MAKDGLRFLDLNPDDIPFPSPSTILDKEHGIRTYISYMLDRTNAMFEYTNLPETIPAYLLELYLQIFGYAAFAEIKSSDIANYGPNAPIPSPGLYIFYGGIGGERDIYYRPTTFIIANPRLKSSLNCTIIYPEPFTVQAERPSAILMRNDTNYSGLLPLYNRYASQLVENDISIRSAQINARAQIGIAVSTDAEHETAKKYFDNLEAGKLGVVGTSAFLNGISISNVGVGSANVIIQLIELQQYLKASWFNELGLNANFNMKREYLSRDEIATTTDILLPLIDDMLKCRKEAVELINKTFGTNISVDKSSAWANKNQEVLASIMEQSKDASIPAPDSIESQIGGSNDAPSSSVQLQQNSKVSDDKSESSSGEIGDSGGLGENMDREQQNAGEQEANAESNPQTDGQTEITIAINIDGEQQIDSVPTEQDSDSKKEGDSDDSDNSDNSSSDNSQSESDKDD